VNNSIFVMHCSTDGKTTFS